MIGKDDFFWQWLQYISGYGRIVTGSLPALGLNTIADGVLLGSGFSSGDPEYNVECDCSSRISWEEDDIANYPKLPRLVQELIIFLCKNTSRNLTFGSLGHLHQFSKKHMIALQSGGKTNVLIFCFLFSVRESFRQTWKYRLPAFHFETTHYEIWIWYPYFPPVFQNKLLRSLQVTF